MLRDLAPTFYHNTTSFFSNAIQVLSEVNVDIWIASFITTYEFVEYLPQNYITLSNLLLLNHAYTRVCLDHL